MRCLNDVEIQAVVDHEATEDVQQHVAACARCGDRVRDREKRMAAVGAAINIPIDVPAGVARRVEQALVEGSSQGATRLRGDAPQHKPWRRTAWSAAVVVAATLITIVFVAPMFKGESTVTAAEILSRSVDRLSQTATTGVESLEYELTVDGMTREIMPDQPDGVYRVRQVIDHDMTGRYLLATYGPDGQLLSSVAQDPASHQRVMAVQLEGQWYRFELTVPENVTLSPPEIERLHMQASVAMMQASGNQQLQVIESGSGRQYRIQVPRLSAQTSNAVWDLEDARVVIDATDYHIVEFAVKGTFLKQPYSVSYKLIRRAVMTQAEVPAGTFEVPRDSGAITIRGEGSAILARDALVGALRELARAKQAR
jgi:hypothetical protein